MEIMSEDFMDSRSDKLLPNSGGLAWVLPVLLLISISISGWIGWHLTKWIWGFISRLF